MDDVVKKLFVDSKQDIDIKADDFIVAVGKLKSNSIYHVIESRRSERACGFRFHLKVMRSDLPTCIRRDSNQKLIPMVWYNRNKKIN